MKLLQCLVVVLLAGVSSLSMAASVDETLAAELLAIQHAWDDASYRTTDPALRTTQLEALSKRAGKFVTDHPGKAEPLIWNGIVLSSYAGAKGGVGALSIVKQSRDSLLQALKIEPNALNGSAYTSLGALYYKVPGFPLSFGNRDKATEYLRTALAQNPDGIDPNFFYGELLLEKGDAAAAVTQLNKALAAHDRPDRPVADAGRRAEIKAVLVKAQAKLR